MHEAFETFVVLGVLKSKSGHTAWIGPVGGQNNGKRVQRKTNEISLILFWSAISAHAFI